MAKRGRSYGKILLIVIIVLGVAIAYRQSLIPAALNPLPTLDLANPRGWTGGLLIDWQLASIKRSRRLCEKVLEVAFDQICADPRSGWAQGVRLEKCGPDAPNCWRQSIGQPANLSGGRRLDLVDGARRTSFGRAVFRHARAVA